MKYCDYVNIKQGSDSRHRFSNGNTLPLVQLPFGMAAFCPQTAEDTEPCVVVSANQAYWCGSPDDEDRRLLRERVGQYLDVYRQKME